MPSNSSKRWYKSKTVWFNTLTIVVAVASFYGWTPNDDLAQDTANLLVATAPLVNIALRITTKKAITK